MDGLDASASSHLSATPRPPRTALLRLYAFPVALVLIGAPLTGYAVYRSVQWLGMPFPAFLLMENRVIPSVSGYDWPPGKGELFHAQVIEVDGEPVVSSAAVYDAAARRPAGTSIEYGFRKDGRFFRQRIASRLFTPGDYVQVYVILLMVGILNLALGFTVGVLQPHSPQARVYAILSFVGCLFAVTPVFLHQGGVRLLTVVYLAAESAFPAAFVHFALRFPVDRWGRGPGLASSAWPVLLYAIAAVLFVIKLRGFYADPPELDGFYASYLFIAVSFVVFTTLVLAAYRRETDTRAQLRIRALIPSVTFGGALAAFVFLNHTVAGGDVPMQLGLLLVPVFFASVAYAIVAHDLFGIDRFVRSAFVYAALSVLVYAIYMFAGSLAPVLAGATGSSRRVVLGLAFVTLAVAFDPLRRLAQRVVDRAYYRTPWSYRDTVSRVSREMTTWRSVERIMEEMTRVLTHDMQLESTAVCLLDGTPPWYRQADGPLRRLDAFAGIEAVAAAFGDDGEPRLLSTLADAVPEESGREAVRAFLASVQATVIVPMVFAHRPTGFIVLGPPRSRRAVHAEDLELVRTLADQAAIAIANALSYEALEEHNRTLNETVRRRTAQLLQSEQLAALGQLVAGVAHELNNPVGAVHSSVDNLRDHVGSVERLVRAYEASPRSDAEARQTIEAVRRELGVDGETSDTRELLDICSEGSERVRTIVRDLLTFARGDRAERLPVDVTAGLESTLRLLGDRLERAGIRLERRYQAVPVVRANAAQLNQVWMNILGNAIDAVDGRISPGLVVSVQPRRDGAAGNASVEVEIRDNGAGMSTEVQAKIFEPFFTTKEIGKGTGLGMSIVYGAVRDHGGTIEIDSRVDEGTAVRVRLPLSGGAADRGGAPPPPGEPA